MTNVAWPGKAGRRWANRPSERLEECSSAAASTNATARGIGGPGGFIELSTSGPLYDMRLQGARARRAVP
jgi:hypothetical protein